MPVCGEAVEHNFPSAFNGGTNFIMTTLHCLIGGMDSRGHIDEIKLLMGILDVHILALNETNIDPGYHCELTAIAGYQVERLERLAIVGGVSINVRYSITFNLRADVPIEDLELICIEILPQKCNSFLDLALYRPLTQ